jgi:cell filamentation protein
VFDPFGDFATEGYLRNFDKEKDLEIPQNKKSFAPALREALKGKSIST